MLDATGAATVRKIARRLIPIMILLYFVSFLDRVNVGFAALTMNQSIGIDAAQYGFAAGIFFLGYFLFEVPSNLILARVGARLWIARIMITWGLISAAMATVDSAQSFYVLRFLLGVAEAGFFPGMILYLTYWFPAAVRARYTAGFMIAVPLSSALGGPVSGWLLGWHGLAGLHGWQWLFIVEGLPAVVLGFVVLFVLDDSPKDARWLSPTEKSWLAGVLDAERQASAGEARFSLLQALSHPRVLSLALLYFGLVVGLYGIGMWMPQIIKNFGLSNLQVGFVSMIPYTVAAVTMLMAGRSSDVRGERVWHVAVPALVGALGFAASALLTSPPLALLALTVAAAGIYAAIPTFWSLPTAFLGGTAAAAGIAWINAIGNLGGFVGPYLVGAIKNATGDFSHGLLALAVAMLSAAVLAVLQSRRETAPAAAGARI